jgi:hypothetical protein
MSTHLVVQYCLYCSLFRLAFERLPSWGVGHAVSCIGDRVNNLKIRTTTTANSSTVPLLYRSKIFPAISHGSPSVLLDLIQSESELSVFISVYNMTFRCPPDFSCFEGLLKFYSPLCSTPDSGAQGEETTPTDIYSSSLTKVQSFG